MRREQMDSARLGISTYFGPSRLYSHRSNSVLGAILAKTGGVDFFDLSF
jgi:hypothetical protein